MAGERGGLPAVYGLFAAMTVGAAVLALEVLAARTMAPAVGTGSAAWAALLAVALGALACGNLLGGVLADRRRPDGAVAWALVMAAAVLVVLPHMYRPAMRWATDQGLVTGSLAAAGVTQMVPMLLLGLIAPVLVKSRRQPVRGVWAGAVLAAGSAGGIGGALVMGLTLLPAVGIGRAYLVIAAVLALAAVPAAVMGRRWIAGGATLLVLVAVAVSWFARRPEDTIQSRYAQIEVHDEDDTRVLFIDGLPQTGMPGRLAPWQALRAGHPLELALLYPPRPATALVIGLGAGLAARILETHGLTCESIELDPAVVAVARDDFGFTGPVTVGDGRRFLERTNREWDLIVIDVCTSEHLAFHLFTREAFALARRRLNPAGVLAVQFIGDDGRWSASVQQTAKAVFGEGLLVAPTMSPGPVGPCWLFARRDGRPPGLPPMPDAHPGQPPPWRIVAPDAAGFLLTDDRFAAAGDWATVARLWRRHSGR